MPEHVSRELDARQDDAEAVAEFGVSYATMQCADLLANGAPGIHFCTLNRSPATRAILSALRLLAAVGRAAHRPRRAAPAAGCRVVRRAPWLPPGAQGNYARMAWRLRPAAARVVEMAEVAAGDAVLDVACGTGNGALAAAARGGAPVVGVDLEPALLELAREAAPDVPVDWRVGDAVALPVDDGAFDVVVSVFGVMYAFDQPAAARELARACSPVGVSCWPTGCRKLPAGDGRGVVTVLAAATSGRRTAATLGRRGGGDGAVGRRGLGGRRGSSRVADAGVRGAGAGRRLPRRDRRPCCRERPRLEAEGRWPSLLARWAASSPSATRVVTGASRCVVTT